MNPMNVIVNNLMGVLEGQAAVQDELLEQIAAHRNALRRGSADEIVAALNAQNTRVQRLSELEKQRLRLTADLTLALDPRAKRPMTLGELLPHLDAAWSVRLGAMRETLRGKAQRVRRELSPLRQASESLLRAMQGVLREMNQAAGAGLYAARQARQPQAPALSTFSATA